MRIVSVVGVIAIVIIVWSIMLINSARLQALLYSFPIPISIALVSMGGNTGAVQVIGVALLVLFFYIVHIIVRLTRSRLLAVAVGVGAYCLLAIAGRVMLPTGEFFSLVLSIVLALWAVHFSLSLILAGRLGRFLPSQEVAGGALEGGRLESASLTVTDVQPTSDAVPVESSTGARRRASTAASQGGGGAPDLTRKQIGAAQFVSVPVATTLAALLGNALSGFVVTFPFSGVPVALSMSQPLIDFAREFGYRSIALLFFVAAFHYSFSLGLVAAFSIAWASFGVGALAVSGALRLLTSSSTAISG